MQSKAVVLIASLSWASCHAPSGALRDEAPEAAGQATALPIDAAAPVPSDAGQPVDEDATGGWEPTSSGFMPPPPAWPTQGSPEARGQIDEQPSEDALLVRVDALEKKLQQLQRAQAAAPTVAPAAAADPVASALGLLPLVLGLLALLAVAAAVVAVARARRTRAEVVRLQAAGRLLVQKAKAGADDEELDRVLRRILVTGA